MKKKETTYIYGKHALDEALRYAPQAIKEVLFADTFSDDSLRHRAGNLNVPIHAFGSKHPPGGVESEDVHQGVVIRVDAGKLVRQYGDFVNDLEVTENTSLVLLGELEDPHNVGAIIRNAAAFGVAGVLLPEHNQAPITPTVVKVSAGMAFRVPLVSIGNVNTTIADLKERGFWIYGLAGEGEEPLAAQDFATPTVFVVGNEAEGIRAKTKEHCDKLVKIPTADGQSLNVAASTAVAFYDWQQKRGA
ncbi:MAG: 23S rRNA (guanosine(2251)-2'-O)-methyltransferase RlmB [Candidatus Paceibacterota bacterium]